MKYLGKYYKEIKEPMKLCEGCVFDEGEVLCYAKYLDEIFAKNAPCVTNDTIYIENKIINVLNQL